ncbi:MAG: lecithin retinol acyltransferase family protein [Eubacteriales bacterium]
MLPKDSLMPTLVPVLTSTLTPTLTTIMGNPLPDLLDAIEPQEIWSQITPNKGDHIRVDRGMYTHHGVYFAEEEIIHFTGAENDNIMDWSKNEVITSNLQEFLRGGVLEVRGYTQEEERDLYHPNEIHAYAKSCLGDRGYNLFFNNCEHFANTCTLGQHRSKQIERLATRRSPVDRRRGGNMGLFGSVGGFFRGLFGGGSSGGGSRSSSSTVYEPDKVKVAEIEQQTQLLMADKELERIEYMKNAQLDILTFQTNSQIALEQARAQGLNVMADIILELQDKLNNVAKKRLEIIEQGSLHLVQEMETFYHTLEEKVQEDDDRYNTEKLPQLLSLLEKYEVGSPSHTLYMKRIEEDMALQGKHYVSQLANIAQRQNMLHESFIRGKEKVLEQTGQITQSIMENIVAQSTALSQSAMSGQVALGAGSAPQLEAPSSLPALGDGTEE